MHAVLYSLYDVQGFRAKKEEHFHEMLENTGPFQLTLEFHGFWVFGGQVNTDRKLGWYCIRDGDPSAPKGEGSWEKRKGDPMLMSIKEPPKLEGCSLILNHSLSCSVFCPASCMLLIVFQCAPSLLRFEITTLHCKQKHEV